MPDFADFNILWLAGRYLIFRGDPYLEGAFFYPLPTAFIFAPFAMLPREWAGWVWFALSAILLVISLERKTLLAILFIPVLQTMNSGQIAILLLFFFVMLRKGRYKGVMLAFLAFKPQLVVLLGPWLLWKWWREERKEVYRFFITTALLWIPAFIIMPDWPLRWLGHTRDARSLILAPSLWGILSYLLEGYWWVAVCAVSSLALFVWAWWRDMDIVNAASMLGNPAIISYDLTLLLGSIDSWWWCIPVVVASWVAQMISNHLYSGAPSVLVSLVTLALMIWVRRRDNVDEMKATASTGSNG